MVRATRPKFTNVTRDQQSNYPDLHFVNYRALDKAIGSRSRGLPPAVDTVNFVEAVSAEICLVNTSFERRRLELLQSIAGLRQMLEKDAYFPEAIEPQQAWKDQRAIELILEERNSVDGSSSQFWPNACRCLVDVLQGLTRLREYSVWNIHALTKLHRRWSKQVPSDVQDKNLLAVIEHLQANGASEWLGQLRFFDGLEFAEVYIAVESLDDCLTATSSWKGAGAFLEHALQPSSRQGSPDRPTPRCRPSLEFLEQDAIVHSLASSGSDAVSDALIEIDTLCPAHPEPLIVAHPKDGAASVAAASIFDGSLEVSTRCIACLSEIACSATADIIPSSSTVPLCESSTAAQFGCGHRLCHTCFGLGRPRSDACFQPSEKETLNTQAECAICRNCTAFNAKDSNGIRSFRGVLAQFQQNLFTEERCKGESLCKGEDKVACVLDPTAAALAKHEGELLLRNEQQMSHADAARGIAIWPIAIS